MALRYLGAGLLLSLAVGGCGLNSGHHLEKSGVGSVESAPLQVPDTRETLGLGPQARQEHRAVMLQHLETVEQVVAALAREDFALAQGLTELHLGFAVHRQAMARQRPEDFPPRYHDLAMAHHDAAEELARGLVTRDLKQVLPRLDGVLKACVACHREFRP